MDLRPNTHEVELIHSSEILETESEEQLQHEEQLQLGDKPFTKISEPIGEILNKESVQYSIIVFIVINSIMMGIRTFDFVSENDILSTTFEVIDKVFLVIFTIEIFLHFVHRGLRLFSDRWLLFDFIIVALSWAVNGAQVFRALRILRTLRLIPKVKVMRNLVDALLNALPQLISVVILLSIVVLISSIMFTEMFKDFSKEMELEFDYFSRLDNTVFTLLQFITLDNWAAVARDMMQFQPFAWCPVLLFIIVSGFIILNIVVGVICESISVIDEREKKKIYGDYVESMIDDLQSEDVSGDVIDVTSDEVIDATIKNLRRQIDVLIKSQSETMKTLDEIIKNLPN